MGTRNTPPESLHLWTGKSHVISVIKECAHLGAVEACILMAPAAYYSLGIKLAR